MEEFRDILLNKYGYDAPILVDDLTETFPNKSRATLYRLIDAAIAQGMLSRYCQGVYYLPRKTRFGNSELYPDDVVTRLWLQRGNDTIGYVSGDVLANRSGVSDQVPACLEITTNKETTRVREVASFGGWKKIVLRRPRQTVTSENVDALRFLDLITNETLSLMNNASLEALKTLAKKIDKAQLFKCAESYPAKTAKCLIECESRNVFA